LGIFQCAGCLQSAAKIPNNELAQELSKELIQMSALPVQSQSQDTYYYALKRFQIFAEELILTREQALPVTPGEGINAVIIKYYILWAKNKYAPKTIQLTLSAINDWHRSKNISLRSYFPLCHTPHWSFKLDWSGNFCCCTCNV